MGDGTMIDRENPYKWSRSANCWHSPGGRFTAGREKNEKEGGKADPPKNRYYLLDNETGETTVHVSLRWAERYAMAQRGPKDCKLCYSCESYRRKTKCQECHPRKYDDMLSEYKTCETEFVRVSSSGGFYRLRRTVNA
jgi:hypothetical protein